MLGMIQQGLGLTISLCLRECVYAKVCEILDVVLGFKK